MALGYAAATSDPKLRRLSVALPAYPPDEPPVRIVLLSDLHVHGPDMPPERVERIVGQINALNPDLVVAAGDFVSANWLGPHYAPDEAIRPLKGLKARFGAYAVLGNNDYDSGRAPVAEALQQAGVRVLVNEVVEAGPLALAGIDGRLLRKRPEWNARRAAVYARLRTAEGAKLVVFHRPDEFRWTPDWVGLALAGHTHCGQIVLPLVGPLETASDFGGRYLCGLISEAGKLMVVTAGLGTSKIPLRIGAPPDLWLIEVRASKPDGR